jgi:hypothetical protein
MGGVTGSCHGRIVVISCRDHDLARTLDRGTPCDRGRRLLLCHVLRIAPARIRPAGDDEHLPQPLWPIRHRTPGRARSVERGVRRKSPVACPFPACDRRHRNTARSAGRSDQRTAAANAGPPRISHRIRHPLWRRHCRLCPPLSIQSRCCSQACRTTLPLWACRHTYPTRQSNEGGLKSLSDLRVAVRNGGMHVEVGRPMRLWLAPIRQGARFGCVRLCV